MKTNNQTTQSNEGRSPDVGTSALLGAPWKNVTSYSRGEKDCTPRSWQACFGRLRICVTRHIGYPRDAWVLRCHDLGLERPLASPDIQEAARQAKAIVQGHLEQLLRDISA